MKKILFLAGMAALISTSGCIVPVRDGSEHARYEHHDDVIVGPPVVVVPAPVVVVRPPELIIR